MSFNLRSPQAKRTLRSLTTSGSNKPIEQDESLVKSTSSLEEIAEIPTTSYQRKRPTLTGSSNSNSVSGISRTASGIQSIGSPFSFAASVSVHDTSVVNDHVTIYGVVEEIKDLVFGTLKLSPSTVVHSNANYIVCHVGSTTDVNVLITHHGMLLTRPTSPASTTQVKGQHVFLIGVRKTRPSDLPEHAVANASASSFTHAAWETPAAHKTASYLSSTIVQSSNITSNTVTRSTPFDISRKRKLRTEYNIADFVDESEKKRKTLCSALMGW